MPNLRIIKNLASPVNLFVAFGCAVFVFDVHYYLMSHLVGTRDFACVVGANLTAKNILFSLLISLMTGIMLAGALELYRRKASQLVSSSATGIAVFIGTMTMFCAACTLPFVSVFGLSIGLGFFTTYQLWLQLLSLLLLLVGMYSLNNQLDEKNVACKIA